jgi:hypothetical protein
MSIAAEFNSKRQAKPLSPFSIRLTAEERARLVAEAKGAPLGTYIKAKALGAPIPARVRRSGIAVEDRQALAKVLALLGGSRLASNLNQLAKLANTGALPVDPETEAELADAASIVREIRLLLLIALGMKEDGQ